MTRQLLLFSRRETARPERLDLNEVVRGAMRMLQRLVRANITLAVEPADERLPVEADRGQLQQVLMNLALKAFGAMPDGGTVTIRTAALEPDEVCLMVGDSGHGIPEGIRDRIFEPFFTTKSGGEGTGVGLLVVHGIVTQHGGRTEIESAIGKGTTFKVTLPRSGPGKRHLVGEARPVSPAPERARGERTLVVEDEDAAREGLREILIELGYEVAAARSGEEARELIGSGPFDVLLTDLILLGVAGPRLAAELEEQWPGLTVILMSGYTEDEAVRCGVSAGAVRFLQKPFEIASLAREVRAALDDRTGTDER